MEKQSVKPQNNQDRFAGIGALIGLALGYPLSYFFQSRALQAKMSLGEYIEHFPQILGNSQLFPTVVLGVLVAVGVCVTAGILIGRAENQKNK